MHSLGRLSISVSHACTCQASDEAMLSAEESSHRKLLPQPLVQEPHNSATLYSVHQLPTPPFETYSPFPNLRCDTPFEMGAGASKPGDSKQVFTSEHPIQFSQELIDSIQASSETNSTRAKSLDLHIQQRVAAELERLQKEESSRLDDIRKNLTLSSDSDSDSNSSTSKPSSTSRQSSLLELPSISPKDLNLNPFKSETAEEKARKTASSKKVQDEIEKLKKALGERKVLKDLPKEVEEARNGVISCLRLNDRQPLDCWREVEMFKREVRKMEERFVGGVL